MNCETWRNFPEVRTPTAHRCGHCAREYRISNTNMAALKVKRKRRRADNPSAKRGRQSEIEARDEASQDKAPSAYSVTVDNDIVSICGSESTIRVSLFIE